jgi:hypothetical protein
MGGNEKEIVRDHRKTIKRYRLMREIMLRLAVAMLITAAAFIVVAHPPVAIADLLMTTNTRTGKPEASADEDICESRRAKILRQVKLRKLVQDRVTHAHDHHDQP